MCCCVSFIRCHCYYMFLLLEVVVLLLLFMLLCSSCSTYCFAPLAQHRCSPCLTSVLLLLDIGAPLIWRYYSVPLVQPTTLIQCCCSFCSMLSLLVHLGTFLLLPWFCCSLLFLLNVAILVPLVSDWYSPLYFFAGVEELSKFKFLKPNLKGDFFFPIFFVDEFFNYPCFWEIVVGNVFVYYVQELFWCCTFNYTYYISFLHIAFHLHNCIVYFFNELHLFKKNSLNCL